MAAAATFKDPSAVKKLAKVNSEFAFDLYKELVKTTEGNVFFSPLSISTAFAMVYLGAKGETALQMGKSLRFADLADVNLHTTFSDLHSALQTTEKSSYVLKLANRLFARQGYTFLHEFLSDTKKQYRAEATLMDFEKNPEGSREAINTWVEEQTAQRIKELIAPGLIDGLTAMVLVNAIYFKGDWQDKFDPKKTMKEKFSVSKNKEVEVDFMYRNAKYNAMTHPELGCQVLEIPYVNKDLSMIIVLPNDQGQLETLMAKLNPDTLQELFSYMTECECDVLLPKFKLEFDVDLKEKLKKLGMKDIFDRQAADLSGMDGSKNLHVSAAVHKAFIEVNEQGSEAAAATAVMIAFYCMPMTLEFRCTHPFLFFIRENRSKSILFMGRLSDPSV